MSTLLRFGILLAFAATPAMGQSVSSSVEGTLIDSTGASVAGAACKLTRQGTGAVMAAVSSTEGLFVFPNVLAGTYTLSIGHAGFKGLEVKDITVTSSEIRNLGRLSLQVGEVRESVSVTAEATPLQLASAERSGVVTGTQLNDLALKDRDFFALLQTIPGVVDTAADTREVTSNQPQRGIFISAAE